MKDTAVHSDADSDPVGLSRRTVLTGTAWAVPAIAMTASTPAFAASGAQILTISSPNMQAIAKGDTTITVNVSNSNGQPVTSGAVSLTGPSGVSFSPANPTISNGTATSTMTTTDNWAIPGSTLTVTATTSSANKSTGLTAVGANALANGGNGFVWNSATNTISGTGAAGTGSLGVSVTPPTQLLLSFPSPIVSLVSGGTFSLALLRDGTVWSVGQDSTGALGDGSTSRTTWGRIPSLSGVKAIACGGANGYAVLSNGEVRAWGANNHGQLGNGTSTASSTPVAVQNITNAVQVVGNSQAGTAALLSTGEVRTWGYGAHGWLGNGTLADSSVPVAVPGISNAIQLAAGAAHILALLSTGQIRAWAYGRDGELGNGATSSSDSPVAVSGISNATAIAASESSSFALLSTGEVRSWGSSYGGILGNGDSSNSTYPTPVAVSGISNADRIAANFNSAFVHLRSGGYMGWGGNADYDLNDGTTTRRSTPVTFQDTSQVTALQTAGPGSTVFTFRS